MIPEQQRPVKGAGADADPLLSDLTPPQREAVLHVEGPLLILAAAGSGKTRVITRRIAHLIRIGVPPWRILALTFTNKAAGEMRERVAALLDAQGAHGALARGLTVTTFHSLCARLLRRYAPMANLPGISQDYAIYDASDQRALMKRVIGDMGLNTSNWAPRAVLSAISNAKNELKDAGAFMAGADEFYSRTIAKIYKSYEAALRRANAVDFDDLLMLTVRVLRECEPARDEVRDRWRHLMIDEYQDTNHAQFVLASLLIGRDEVEGGGEAGPEAAPNICVVGDPDQSIYGWRGADITNILEFEQVYAGAKVIALGQNFRSTSPILATADALIRNNKQRKHKPLFTEREGGEPPEVVLCRDEHHEASIVVDWFKAITDQAGAGDAPWKEMAVFYRTNALSRVMENALRAAGVPYVIARGTAFYEREEVKDALAYLRVVANPADDVSLRRILNKPARGIGNTTLAKVDTHAMHAELSLFDALRDAANPEGPVGLSARAANAVGKFVALLDSWREEGDFMGEETTGSLPALVERVIRESDLETHYRTKAGKSDAPDEDRLENLAELVSSAREFDLSYEGESDPAGDPRSAEDDESFVPDFAADIARDIEDEQTLPLLRMLRAYLESVALVADADAVDPDRGAVTLMTLHAAKGLEFDAVAIVGLEEGLLPHGRAMEGEAHLEEERRLCFVGITRARKRLLITSARYRTHRGLTERSMRSRFLEEFPAEHVRISDQADDLAEWDEGGSDLDSARERYRVEPVDTPRESDALREGLMVRHPRFGVGRVQAVLSKGANPRVKIAFRGIGEKTIVLGYAPLEILE